MGWENDRRLKQVGSAETVNSDVGLRLHSISNFSAYRGAVAGSFVAIVYVFDDLLNRLGHHAELVVDFRCCLIR